MKLNRRQFLLLSAGLVAGCQTITDTSRVIPAGNTADYPADGVYGRFVDQGFFLVRKSGRLIARSAICTHRKCKLRALSDHSFYCRCHGSAFDPDGHVTHGPARRDLPELPVNVDDQGRLFVTVTTS
ncbi:MAG TPA: Rieske (2Fe-2S) protein [Candidatus Acidoferrum sp.]|nr:Rieske (2Fe-2S) protein [Candidatus Acidoferrum sp.]